MLVTLIVGKKRATTVAQSHTLRRHITQVGGHVNRRFVPVLDTCGSHHQRTIHKGTRPHRRIFRLPAFLVGGSSFHLVGAKVYMLREGHQHLYHVALRPLS